MCRNRFSLIVFLHFSMQLCAQKQDILNYKTGEFAESLYEVKLSEDAIQLISQSHKIFAKRYGSRPLVTRLTVTLDSNNRKYVEIENQYFLYTNEDERKLFNWKYNAFAKVGDCTVLIATVESSNTDIFQMTENKKNATLFYGNYISFIKSKFIQKKKGWKLLGNVTMGDLATD